jgi:hypothetical protein
MAVQQITSADGQWPPLTSVVMQRIKIIISIILVLITQTALSAKFEYEQFEEKIIFKGRPVEPNLVTHKDARTYRTVLKRQSKEGPNFAGHYTIVRIGCGTSCAKIAVVDAETGHVYFPENVHYVFWAGWWHEPYGPEFRLTSRLLIVYGKVNSEDAPYGVSYFEWTGMEFKLVHFEATDRGQPPQ